MTAGVGPRVKPLIRRPALTFGVVLALACGLAACSKTPSAEHTLDAGTDAGPPPLTTCESNVECQGGEVCRGDQCREACTSNNDCDHDFYRSCSTALGYCVRCAENTDCAKSELCEENLCKMGCAGDGDCMGGQACRERRCVPLDPVVCEAGTEQCRGGSIVRCSADGVREDIEACARDQLCSVEDGVATCKAKVCEPSAIGCDNGTTAFVCSEDGTRKLEVPCRSGQFCDSGVCRNQVCAPQSESCVGNQRIVCNSDGSSFETRSCAENCQGTHGCTCVSGACVERTCTPDAGQCVGTGVRTCNSGGTGWSSPEPCEDVCVGGSCVSSTCTAGETQCSGAQLLTCNPLGTGYEITDCASTNQVCVGGAGPAACAARVCTPDALRCESGGGAVLVCNASGTVETREPCADGQACDQGLCLEIPCVPDCSGRSCGPDPVCGQSCGGCAGTCTGGGQCQIPQNQGLEVRLSWTPSTVDLDLYLVKEAGSACDASTCYHGTCTNDATRPDWDGSGDLSDGDPALTFGPGGISGPGPEVIRLLTPQGVVYIAGVHYASSGSASAMATVTFKRGTQTLGTVNRTLAAGEWWKAISIDMSQPSPTPNPGTVEGTIAGCSGMSCAVDTECPSGMFCNSVIPGLPAGNCAVGCRTSADCTTGVCNGNHVCSTSAAGWGSPCSASADCAAGLYCSIFAQTCQEYCSGVGACLSDPTCCPVSNALFCRQGALFASCSNTP